MAKKFTYEEHLKRMKEIIASPVERPNIAGSLLKRVRGRGTRPATPLPQLPKLPKVPRV